MNDAAIRAEIQKLVDEAETIQYEAPEPDPLAYQPFPVDLLPEPVRGYILASAAAIGCDPAFIALPILAAIAGAIGNTWRTLHVQFTKATNTKVPTIQSEKSQSGGWKPTSKFLAASQRISSPADAIKPNCAAVNHVKSRK